MPEFTSLDIFNFFSQSSEREDMHFKSSITYDFVTYHKSFKEAKVILGSTNALVFLGVIILS